MQAGDLRERIGFYQRVDSDDGAGNVQAGYAEKPFFQAHANVRPKLGGEGIQAGRLAGSNFVNITVRRSANALLVTTDWRAKDERTGAIYNIRSGPIDPDQKRRWLELLCEEGVAA
jgi:SPP1 family predicted phage head-tail adaptor